MTNKEAIKRLKDIFKRHYVGAENMPVLKMCIKALEQESCEDCISKTDILDAVGHGITYTSEEIQEIINRLPSVTPARTKGEWVEDEKQKCTNNHRSREGRVTMSMVSKLIERLRETANDIFMNLDADFPVCKSDGELMCEAADALEMLSKKVRKELENDE